MGKSMSQALNDLLSRLRKEGDPKVREWHGRLNYTSPRMAETWNVPEQPLTFEAGIGTEATRRVMSQYRNEVLEKRGLKSAEEIFHERTQSPPMSLRRQSTSGNLTPFEEAFRVEPMELKRRGHKRKPGLLRRLFGRS